MSLYFIATHIDFDRLHVRIDNIKKNGIWAEKSQI